MITTLVKGELFPFKSSYQKDYSVCTELMNWFQHGEGSLQMGEEKYSLVLKITVFER